MNIPIYATYSDIKRCSNNIKKFMDKEVIKNTEEQLILITIDIMNISYSHGGDYSDDIISKFSEGYFDSKLYSKYL